MQCRRRRHRRHQPQRAELPQAHERAIVHTGQVEHIAAEGEALEVAPFGSDRRRRLRGASSSSYLPPPPPTPPPTPHHHLQQQQQEHHHHDHHDERKDGRTD